ncbi:lysyl-tRNA synthetase, class 2 [Syntrophus gentianae]|uniref:Lysyl-tRNA synthetase, class 2 n=1 Tax=Syntrophus gentianae TaxID=43775 RepID=A0A1H7YNU9_9BACT|nr:EF-P lysine aminoacylase EpmA [Syntrophus gentianae]SEM46968.1 lysyl-tRNA synthetase, class 2 [Syntrophus gentianae]
MSGLDDPPGNGNLTDFSKNAFPEDNPFNSEGWKLAGKREVLRLRAEILHSIRRFFRERDYLEVETPILIPAPAPELHIDAVACGAHYLQTSPELCMKRLLSAGYPRLFQICHCFREAERGSRHLPEFTMLEWYAAGKDYSFLMEECEDLFRFLADALYGKEEILFGSRRVDLSAPWERLSVEEAFRRYGGMSVRRSLAEDRFDEVLVTRIEPKLGVGRPTFIYDYPVELAALARTKEGDPSLAERFELYLAGIELANAFSELVDPQEQTLRFHEEQQQRSALGKRPYPWPDRFLQALSAMPPSAGIALGIDRLVMLFADRASVDDVVAFPPEEL